MYRLQRSCTLRSRAPNLPQSKEEVQYIKSVITDSLSSVQVKTRLACFSFFTFFGLLNRSCKFRLKHYWKFFRIFRVCVLFDLWFSRYLPPLVWSDSLCILALQFLLVNKKYVLFSEKVLTPLKATRYSFSLIHIWCFLFFIFTNRIPFFTDILIVSLISYLFVFIDTRIRELMIWSFQKNFFGWSQRGFLCSGYDEACLGCRNRNFIRNW